jgi:predicted RND superfamily exporter protein
MQVSFKDKSLDFYNPEVLRKLEKVETYLLNTYGAGALFSPVGMFKEANRVLHSGQNSYFKLPETDSEFKKAKSLVEKYLYKNYPKVLTEDFKTGRFSGKMGDLGSHEIIKRNNLMADYFKKEGLDKEMEWHVTGSAHLMELNNINIAQNVYYGIIFSCLLIAAIIGFMLRSFKMAIIGIIVNVLPILFVGGIMGLAGVNIKISTSILFIISFGIAVDDTIHFMSSYRFDRKKYPNDTMKALLETYKSTGKSIIVTSLILCGGFFTLVFSSFGGTFHIGLFTGICLIIALLCDIMLLPVLLYYFRDKSKDRGEVK